MPLTYDKVEILELLKVKEGELIKLIDQQQEAFKSKIEAYLHEIALLTYKGIEQAVDFDESLRTGQMVWKREGTGWSARSLNPIPLPSTQYGINNMTINLEQLRDTIAAVEKSKATKQGTISVSRYDSVFHWIGFKVDRLLR